MKNSFVAEIIRLYGEELGVKPGDLKAPALEKVLRNWHDKEIEQLEVWKQQASRVLDQLDLQAIGRALGLEIGDNVAPSVLGSILLLQDRLAKAQEAIRENHVWHESHDEYGGYPESELCEINIKNIGSRLCPYCERFVTEPCDTPLKECKQS